MRKSLELHRSNLSLKKSEWFSVSCAKLQQKTVEWPMSNERKELWLEMLWPSQGVTGLPGCACCDAESSVIQRKPPGLPLRKQHHTHTSPVGVSVKGKSVWRRKQAEVASAHMISVHGRCILRQYHTWISKWFFFFLVPWYTYLLVLLFHDQF